MPAIPARRNQEIHMSDAIHSYRVITRKQAENLGMAASVAGGYVAINGPRIDRISRDEYARIQGEVERISTDGCSDQQYADEQSSLLRSYRHALRGGDHAAISAAGDGLLLKAPADMRMAEMGWPVPASMLEEIKALLTQAGYDA
jgi:hypothetical protein